MSKGTPAWMQKSPEPNLATGLTCMNLCVSIITLVSYFCVLVTRLALTDQNDVQDGLEYNQKQYIALL